MSTTRLRIRVIKVSLLAILVMASITIGAAPSLAGLTDVPVPLGSLALQDNDAECTGDGLGDLTPAALATGVAPSDEVALDVLFLLDGISKKEAKLLIAASQVAYEPLRIRLVPTFKRFPIAPEGTAKDGQPTAGIGYLLDEMRSVFPSSPAGSDVVHLLTSKDLLSAGSDPNGDELDELGGIAACVGGIRFDGLEFSISEAQYRFADVPAAEDPHAIFLGHEIGHLLGAHHHYGNCVEGEELVTETQRFCTLMNANYVVFNSLKFGTLEARVIRGYTEAYATP